MEDRIARALNRLCEDAGILSANTDGLLDLLDDVDPLGKTPPNTHLNTLYHYYCKGYLLHNRNNRI